MGGDQITNKNLRVVSIDPERNIILIKGSVPGADNSIIAIRSTGKMAKVKQVVKKKEKKAAAKPKGK